MLKQVETRRFQINEIAPMMTGANMLKKDWYAVPEGAIYPVLYPAGSVLTGELLERAKAEGLIEETSLKAHDGAPENKKRSRRK